MELTDMTETNASSVTLICPTDIKIYAERLN